MNSKVDKHKKVGLSQKDQLIEAMAVGLAVLLLLASALKVIFL